VKMAISNAVWNLEPAFVLLLWSLPLAAAAENAAGVPPGPETFAAGPEMPRPVPIPATGFQIYGRGFVAGDPRREQVSIEIHAEEQDLRLPKAVEDGYDLGLRLRDRDLFALFGSVYRAGIDAGGGLRATRVDDPDTISGITLRPNAYFLPVGGYCSLGGESLAVEADLIDKNDQKVRLVKAPLASVLRGEEHRAWRKQIDVQVGTELEFAGDADRFIRQSRVRVVHIEPTDAGKGIIGWILLEPVTTDSNRTSPPKK
jgi:hypothetical protein